ncbi:hypothetical protein BKP56_06445 [Marinilactibacillus sp. 15R]|uniref:N-acyl amino acid synthase FeeM domain-containing protein n=1 Tax=Marinilactibacillus sp. 15R TaxID=1911586 RepID=UPI00090BEC87|nr:acyl-homoserine-lactone synthase [Marinilactibacillus sp. 15R]API88939.1 hypothetical protein BKP56_06445 [Marinilactibacillus sp. 15R]
MDNEEEYYFGIAEGTLCEEAVALHHQRYQEVGFFKQNMKDPYIESSTYFIVQTPDRSKVVGVTRLIFMSLEELPTVKHFNIFEIEKLKLAGIERSKYAEISAFTKMPKHDVGLGLIKTVLSYSLNNGLTHWVCCIDERVYRYMHRIFKFPFEIIGEPNVYLGSKTIPCVLNLAECLETLKEKRRALYDYFMSDEEKEMEVL